ncbi:acetyltransferase (GNAT) family protein [Kushneria sinocarnis]|uniref:Acetyltransferase (GNAT) family protein n=1 Tax=Kushneria sinocarnis TaxID=595502 RepID=A0A420X040_9GAMM|nr:GNAT family N-acetyltransferase [Kushneria sinocarnis]RKR06815.1 acetyltransferase (GNAT) family protein [Kushneria sinocarnis]
MTSSVIERLETPEARPLAGLAELLRDSVAGGAAMGFLAPLSHEAAGRWWRHEAPAPGPHAPLWVASREGHIEGAVQLNACRKPSGRHRGEVLKLMVHSRARGQGLASRLMTTLEAHAATLGLTLLLLDTRSGSPAETLYTRLGWERYGEVPGYSLDPDGSGPWPTAFYFRRL